MDIGLESVLDRRRREVPVEGVEAVLLLPRHDVPPRRCGSPPQSLRGPTRADRRHAAPRPLLQAVQCRQRLQPPRHLHELGLTTPLQELPVAPPEAVSEVSRSAGELEDDYLEGVPEGDDLACNEGDADGPTGRVPRVHQVHAVHDEEVPEEHAEVEAVVVVVHVRPEEGVRGQGEDRHEHPEGHVLAAAEDAEDDGEGGHEQAAEDLVAVPPVEVVLVVLEEGLVVGARLLPIEPRDRALSYEPAIPHYALEHFRDLQLDRSVAPAPDRKSSTLVVLACRRIHPPHGGYIVGADVHRRPRGGPASLAELDDDEALAVEPAKLEEDAEGPPEHEEEDHRRRQRGVPPPLPLEAALRAVVLEVVLHHVAFPSDVDAVEGLEHGHGHPRVEEGDEEERGLEHARARVLNLLLGRQGYLLLLVVGAAADGPVALAAAAVALGRGSAALVQSFKLPGVDAALLAHAAGVRGPWAGEAPVAAPCAEPSAAPP
mmetsp:Transcript_49805/g.159153  ORF Transcript_49805/g.159153 Transcript_49805/m.159153 type:complete len:487 (-) Transcript_49805:478-1938(-)